MPYVAKKDHVDHDGLVVVLGKNGVIRSVLAGEAKPSDRVLTPLQMHQELAKKGHSVDIEGFVPPKPAKAEKKKEEPEAPPPKA